jgi:hypothetical protein
MLKFESNAAISNLKKIRRAFASKLPQIVWTTPTTGSGPSASLYFKGGEKAAGEKG